MTLADPSNPNACLICEPLVSEGGGGDAGAEHLHRFSADNSLALLQAAHPHGKAAEMKSMLIGCLTRCGVQIQTGWEE